MLLIWTIVFFNFLALVGALAFARVFLWGEDLSQYDDPSWQAVTSASAISSGQQKVLALIDDMRRVTNAAPIGQRLAAARKHADHGFAGTPSNPDELRVTVHPVDASEVPAEWVVAPGADSARRLLYIHGGAFTLGSAASHRALTSAISRRSGFSVLAIDYRLMPENKRFASVKDCRDAYLWMLEHGPDGKGEPEDVYVAGDSAGGNLCLALIAWIRDRNLRPPNAAVAFSPATDNTYQSPSLRKNVSSDPMLGPALGRFMRMPRAVLAWITLMTARARPQNPTLSPLRGDLSGLPPTLVQASADEMLRDDAQRYVNKAVAQGSVAELELWPQMVHVWQLFEHVLPEAGDALDRAVRFLNAHRNRTST